MMKRRIRLRDTFVLPAAVGLCLAACGGGAQGEAEFEQRVLEGGATLTRNPVTGLVWQEPRLLHEELRIGAQAGTGPEVFGSVAGLDVDALGRIYVADGHSSEVRQFAPDGRHIRTFGGEGAGPGELGVIAGFVLDPGGYLWVRTSGRKLSVFDTAGVYLASHSAGDGPFITLPWAAATDDAGMLYERRPLAPATDSTPTYGLVRSTLRPDSGVQPVDTFPLPRYDERVLVSTQGSMRIHTPVPFSGAQLERIDRQGDVWIARTEEYRLVRISFADDTLQIIERAFVPRDVSAAERDSVRRTTGLRGSQLPDSKPALRGILLDREDGGVWVHLDDDDEGVERWDVFDAGGRFLGPVHARLSLQPAMVPVLRSGVLYAVVRDELDVPYVVRLRLREGQ